MPIMLFIFKYKYWIALLSIGSLVIAQAAYTNHLANKLKIAEAKCQDKILKIESQHQKAIQEQQSKINKLSSDYETEKSKYKIQVETVTKYVDKIVDRPIYLNKCVDDDGLHSINSLIKSRSTS